MFDAHVQVGDAPYARTFAALLALAMILSPAATLAADDDPVPAFSELDVDGDGLVSAQEAQVHAALAQVFAEADEDGDGALDRSEFQKALLLMQQG